MLRTLCGECFFQPPSKINIDENARTRYASSQKIETLIEKLQEKGPLVALGQIGPACYTADPSEAPLLTADKKEYAEKLSSTPLEGILDRGLIESACKAMGQEIFDRYKLEAGGNSFAGKKAVVSICDAIPYVAADGFLRKQYIERAWDAMGDKEWQWRA